MFIMYEECIILCFVFAILHYIIGMYVIVLLCLCYLAVTGFCYYQFYCFQDFSGLAQQFNDFGANNSLADFVINTTAFSDISSVICASTSPLREFIDSQLPWFQYQEYTWLALGEFNILKTHP